VLAVADPGVTRYGQGGGSGEQADKGDQADHRTPIGDQGAAVRPVADRTKRRIAFLGDAPTPRPPDQPGPTFLTSGGFRRVFKVTIRAAHPASPVSEPRPSVRGDVPSHRRPRLGLNKVVAGHYHCLGGLTSRLA